WEPESTPLKFLAAPVNVASGMAEGFTSPVGLAALPLFGTRLGRYAFGGAAIEEGLMEAFAKQRTAQQRAGGLLQDGVGGLILPGREVPVLPEVKPQAEQVLTDAAKDFNLEKLLRRLSAPQQEALQGLAPEVQALIRDQAHKLNRLNFDEAVK